MREPQEHDKHAEEARAVSSKMRLPSLLSLPPLIVPRHLFVQVSLPCCPFGSALPPRGPMTTMSSPGSSRTSTIIARVVSSGSLERWMDFDVIAEPPEQRQPEFPLTRVVSSGSIERYIDCPSSGSSANISRQTSFCSLADLSCSYTFNISELHRLLEPSATPTEPCRPTARTTFRPALATTWEYVRVPRRPDSATSNSLDRSSDSDDAGAGDAMSDCADPVAHANAAVAENITMPPLVTSVGNLLGSPTAPYVVYDGSDELDISPVVRSPLSVFEAGKWY